MCAIFDDQFRLNNQIEQIIVLWCFFSLNALDQLSIVNLDISNFSNTTTESGAAKTPSSERLQDFDVYNIESTMPEVMDWTLLEQQLQKAAEEQQQRQVWIFNSCRRWEKCWSKIILRNQVKCD